MSLLCALVAAETQGYAQTSKANSGGNAKRLEELLKPVDIYKPPETARKLLGLDDVYELIAGRGLPIKKAREDFRVSLTNFQRFRASYLPQLGLSSSVTSSTTAISGTDELPGSESRTTTKTYGLGLRGSLPYGVSYGLEPTLTDTDPIRSQQEPSLKAGVTFNVGIELLKGSFFLDGDAAATRAKIDRDLAKQTLASQVLTALLEAHKAYFDFVIKDLRLKVLQATVAQARGVLEDIRVQQSLGEVERLAVVQMELQAAQKEAELIGAEVELANAKEALRDLLDMTAEEFETVYPDLAKFANVTPPPLVDLNQAIETAKSNRPDILQARLTQERAALEVKQRRNDLMPQLRLEQRFGAASLYVRSTDEAFDSERDPHERTSTTGLSISYIIANDPVRFDLKNAITAERNADLQLRVLENQLARDLRNIRSRIDLGARKLDMSTMARDLAERRLEAEYLKYRLGESSVRDLIDAQTQMNDARVNEVYAKIELLSASADLRHAKGLLPEGLEYDPTKI